MGSILEMIKEHLRKGGLILIVTDEAAESVYRPQNLQVLVKSALITS